jgi:pimeloyl-ACP methyl ester carboxylesterase
VLVEIGGSLTRVMDFGHGERVLLTHGGWTGNWELWEQQAETLSCDGWRVVAYDHRGSGFADTEPATINLDALVDDLFEVLDHLGIGRCVVAGESMGTAVALLAVLRDPSRFSGLVLVAGAGVWRRVTLLPFLAGLRIAYRLTLRMFVTLAIPERDVRRYVRRWAISILHQARPAAARRLIRSLVGVDLRPRLPDVHVPTLVIHGSRDPIVLPREGRALAGAIRDAKLVVLPGAGHVPTMTRPAEVSRAIDEFAAGDP